MGRDGVVRQTRSRPWERNRIGGYETSKEFKVLSIEGARFSRDPRKCWPSFPFLLVVSSPFLLKMIYSTPELWIITTGKIWKFPKSWGYPKSSHFNSIFHYKPSSYWGSQVLGNPHGLLSVTGKCPIPCGVPCGNPGDGVRL